MINFIVARHNDNNWHNCLEPSLKQMGNNRVFQIGDQPGQIQNIFYKYTGGILALLQNNCNDNDIVIFCHEDVKILDPFFNQKIEEVLNTQRDIGVLGVTGSTELNEEGGWWANKPEKLRGYIIQGKDNYNVDDGYYLLKGARGYFNDLCVVDGLFLATTGRILKEGVGFDLQTYPDGNDFYDIDFCLTVLEKGYKVACADIAIFHKSQGMGALTDSWKINHDRMVNKWKTKGYKFPVIPTDFKQKETTNNNVIEIEI
jgi:hypothetical protein